MRRAKKLERKGVKQEREGEGERDGDSEEDEDEEEEESDDDLRYIQYTFTFFCSSINTPSKHTKTLLVC